MPFNLETPYSALFAKDQCTVQYIRKHVHGLSFVPQTSEHAQPQHAASLVVKALYVTLFAKTRHKEIQRKHVMP